MSYGKDAMDGRLGAICGLLTGCNTGQRLSLVERRDHSNIRLPFRTEQKDTSRLEVPKSVTFIDSDGNEKMIMTAERDSLTGEYELQGGTLSELTVTAAAKSVAERGGKVNIDFIVTVPQGLMKRDWRLVLNPILDSAGDLMPLDSIEITGVEHYNYNLRRHRQLQREQKNVDRSQASIQKRKEWYNLRRGFRKVVKPTQETFGTQMKQSADINSAVQLNSKGAKLDTVMSRGDDYVYLYSQQIDTRGLASRLKVYFDSYLVNVGDEKFRLAASDTVTFNISSFLQFMDRNPRYVRKTIYRKVTDKMTANIQFQLGRHEVVDTLGNNANELKKVAAKLKELAEGNEFIIDSMNVVAYSSPEGLFNTNRELSERRGTAMKEHLSVIDKFLVLPEDNCIRTLNGAEDWEKLKKLVHESPYIVHAPQIISIIDTQRNEDERELMIRNSYPADYQYMREFMYPQLRAVEFTFHLARRNMVEDVMFTDEIDTEYAKAVELLQNRKYKEAMQKLLEYRDLNAALCYMSLGYNKTAITILDEQPETADREYLKAILYAREGKTEKAVQLYMKSCEMDGSKIMRGELDPEIADLIKAYRLHPEEHQGF